jgi:repressor LexA
MSRELTERQQRVFDYIRSKILNRGYGPTVREIGEHLAIRSPNGVMCHLRALERKNMIKRDANKSRAIELTEPIRREANAGLPLVGRVAAGLCALSFEQCDRIDFGEIFQRDDRFVLEVSGDSMIEAHIADGDYIVVQKQSTAYPGQIVVAQTPDAEATVKYWFPEADRIRLQPANSKMEPIYVKQADVMGVVVGVVRKLR